MRIAGYKGGRINLRKIRKEKKDDENETSGA